MAWQDEKDDDDLLSGADHEDPDPSDQDDEDEPDVMDCPYCGKSVHEQSEWCHHCGKYLSKEDVSPSVPKWIVIGTVLGIAAMLGWFVIWILA